MRDESRPGRAATIAGIALYLMLACWTAAIWEPAHDEGVTWDQAFGAVPLPSGGEPPVAIRTLYESLEARRAHTAAGVVSALMGEGGMHPPAYYLALNVLGRSFGTDRFVLVAPQLALGAFSLWLFGQLARRLATGTAANRWAVWLLATSPWFVAFSVYLRPYALVVCVAIAATLAALRAATPAAGVRPSLAFVALSLLGLYSLYHYAFVVLWHAAFLCATALARPSVERGRAFLAVVALGLAILGGFAPWLAQLGAHLELTGSTPYYFSGVPPLAAWPARALEVLRIFALLELRGDGVFRIAFACLALPTAVLGALSLRPSALRELSASARWMWRTAPLLPLGIVASDLARDTHTIFFSKTSFALLPLFALLALRAASVLRDARARRLLLSGWVALGLAATVGGLVQRGRETSSFEQVAGQLAGFDAPDHLLILSSARRGYVVPLLLQLRSAGIERVSVVHADRDQLALRVLEAARTGVRRVSLLNLAVVYDRAAMWNEPTLRQARLVAQSMGFAVRARSEGRADAGRRVLAIGLPLQSNYFSR